jgi:hypothetical protein
MTTKEFMPLARQQTGTILNNRLLGTLGILGSPMLLLEGLYVGFQQHGTDQFIGLLGVIYMTGWACSILGLRSLKAAGTGWGGNVVLMIQLIGLFLAAVWAGYHVVIPNPDTESLLYQLTDLSWPLSHIFMNVVGVAVLRARVWTGWRRFVPFLGGLALPLALLTAPVAGEVAMGVIFGLLTTTAFASLGYAVRSSHEA